MSDGRQMRGQIVPQGQTKLALAELKSVQWAQGQQLLMAIYQVAARVYFRLRQIPIIGWYILFMEMSVVFSWTLVHNLPWPQIVLDIISRVDSITFRILDFIQQRLEWWWDVASVRLMWFRESVENFLDRNLTIIDHYFARLQDLIMAIYRAIMKPIRPIVDAATTYSSQMTGLKTTDGKQSMSSGSRRRNSEGYEEEDNEDLGDEEYLSDASIDTKRLTKEDSGGLEVTTILDAAEKLGAFLSKLSLGKRKLEAENTENFPVLEEVPLQAGVESDKDLSMSLETVICKQLATLQNSFETWIRNAFLADLDSINDANLVNDDFIDLTRKDTMQHENPWRIILVYFDTSLASVHFKRAMEAVIQIASAFLISTCCHENESRNCLNVKDDINLGLAGNILQFQLLIQAKLQKRSH